jgi:hypothetical protein
MHIYCNTELWNDLVPACTSEPMLHNTVHPSASIFFFVILQKKTHAHIDTYTNSHNMHTLTHMHARTHACTYAHTRAHRSRSRSRSRIVYYNTSYRKATNAFCACTQTLKRRIRMHLRANTAYTYTYIHRNDICVCQVQARQIRMHEYTNTKSYKCTWLFVLYCICSLHWNCGTVECASFEIRQK